MARKLSMVLFATFAVVALLQSSATATTYIVGDSTNWDIPSSADAYSNWAANKTFVVGDILVFNFTQNRHDVAEVTKSAYDACNGTNPISLQTTSPANITLRTAGGHYYICAVTGHCDAGQKLAINVSGALSPAPQPSATSPSPTPVRAPAPVPQSSSPSPSSIAPAPQSSSPSPSSIAPAPQSSSPSSSPAPTPARGPRTYTVGDTSGWAILSGGASAYQTWASNKQFFVGDILVFNFRNGSHDVAEVTKQNYDSCNTSGAISLETNPPVRITLATAGEHFYTCAIPGHCNAGQKLAINVSSDGSTATPPSGATPPSAASSPSDANTPPSTLAPPPQDNGATSLGVAGLSATVFSVITLALWF